MPPQPAWFHRLPAAMEELERLPCPTVDRLALERLLQISKPQAWRLLKQWGAQPVAGGLVLGRDELLARWTSLLQQQPVQQEQRRRQRVVEHLEQLRQQQRARAIPLHVSPDVAEREVAGLPVGISLAPGRLTVEFQGAADLLGKLLEVSMAAANDYERFSAMVES